MNVYNFFSLDQLISILEKQPVHSCEQFVESLYRAVCKELRIEPFEIKFVDNIDIQNRTASKTATSLATSDPTTKTIEFNRIVLGLCLSSQNAIARLHVVMMCIHECRHAMQYFSPSSSPQHTYASLCLIYYKMATSFQLDYADKIYAQMMSKDVSTLDRTFLEFEANGIVRKQLEFQRGYFNFPWEIDAREFSLQFVDEQSTLHPTFCDLRDLVLQQYSKNQQNAPFSMMEFIKDSQQFVRSHNGLNKELATQISQILTKIKRIYQKNGIKTKEDEENFVKKLFPKSFCLDKQPQQENNIDKNKEK